MGGRVAAVEADRFVLPLGRWPVPACTSKCSMASDVCASPSESSSFNADCAACFAFAMAASGRMTAPTDQSRMDQSVSPVYATA